MGTESNLSAAYENQSSKRYAPKGFSRRIRLPFERELLLSGSHGLRPRSYRFRARRQRGAEVGFRLHGKRSEFGMGVSDGPRRYRMWQEKYARIESEINRRLDGGVEVYFCRDHDGSYLGWGSFPLQAEGSLRRFQSGRVVETSFFYFRMRHNHAHLTTYVSQEARDTGQRGAERATAGRDEVYPGDEFAGAFEAEVDMVRVFCELVEELAPVDVPSNPTHAQQIEGSVLMMGLAMQMKDGLRDLRAEEKFLAERDGEVAEHYRQQWAQMPEVAEWIAAGRPDDGALLDLSEDDATE